MCNAVDYALEAPTYACFLVVFSVDRPYFNPHMVIPDVRDAKLKEGYRPRAYVSARGLTVFLSVLGIHRRNQSTLASIQICIIGTAHK